MATTREVPPMPAAADRRGAPYAKLNPGPGKPAAEVAGHQQSRIHSAIVELAAENGYDSITVRQITRVAGVSTRAFYEHFSGKEECFLRAYELVVQRAAKRIIALQAGERDWQGRLRLAFRAFARELQREPAAARLALIEVHAVGRVADEQVRATELLFETMVRESFARVPNDMAMPPFFFKAIVAGAECVARSRLLAHNVVEPSVLGDQLCDWALAFHREIVSTPYIDDGRPASHQLMKWASSELSAMVEKDPSPASDRSLIISAVEKLVATQGYESLTVSRIHAAAGVTRRKFKSYFSGVNDCFLTALELRADKALKYASCIKTDSNTQAYGDFRAVVTICTQIAFDPVLSHLYLVDISGAGFKKPNSRKRIISRIADLAADCISPAIHSSKLAREASVGALFGALRQAASSGQGLAPQPPQTAASLSSLLLTQLIGPAAASEAIGRVAQGIDGKHRVKKLDRYSSSREPLQRAAEHWTPR